MHAYMKKWLVKEIENGTKIWKFKKLQLRENDKAKPNSEYEDVLQSNDGFWQFDEGRENEFDRNPFPNNPGHAC